MKIILIISFLLIRAFTFGQNTDDLLINQSLKLLCDEEVILKCIELSDKTNDTIYFYSSSFTPTEVVKVSKHLYYQISNNLEDCERTQNCVINVHESFNSGGVLMLTFKILKTSNSLYLNKSGLVRCQIINNTKISSVDPRFD